MAKQNYSPTFFIEKVGSVVIQKINDLGAFCLFVYAVFKQVFHRPFRASHILKQLEFIGNDSLNIILMTGFFTGAVLGLQMGVIFELFQAGGLMGGATGKALCRELGPLMTGFLVSGRAGSAMTAEISTMKVNEQIDAMDAMGVDPIDYLVAPRVIASMIIVPFLCGIFIFSGTLGAFFTGVLVFDLDQGVFMEKLVWLVQPNDIINGLEKSFVFAIVISILACRYGLEASGGAKGVGIATTNSVVISLLVLLGFDFVMTYIQFTW